jgi:hypothetical protein
VILLIIIILIHSSVFYNLSGGIWSSACNGQDIDQDERGPYKVDLRLVLESSSPNSPSLIKSFDVANCEVAKDGKAYKLSTNNAKLLIEGKMILDDITKQG